MHDTNEITGKIVDAAYQLYSRLGPGLLESVYETILARYLEDRGLRVERQKIIPLRFEGMYFEEVFRADLLVEGKVVVELKSSDRPIPAGNKQVLTYLRVLELPVGLLINFGAPRFGDVVQRVFNPRVAPPREPAPCGPRADASHAAAER